MINMIFGRCYHTASPVDVRTWSPDVAAITDRRKYCPTRRTIVRRPEPESFLALKLAGANLGLAMSKPKHAIWISQQQTTFMHWEPSRRPLWASPQLS